MGGKGRSGTITHACRMSFRETITRGARPLEKGARSLAKGPVKVSFRRDLGIYKEMGIAIWIIERGVLMGQTGGTAAMLTNPT